MNVGVVVIEHVLLGATSAMRVKPLENPDQMTVLCTVEVTSINDYAEERGR